MAYFVGYSPINAPGHGAEALLEGFSLLSGTPEEARFAVSDGTTLVLSGTGLRYSEDGELLGGAVSGYSFLDGERPLLEVSEGDFSAAAVLGFLADRRIDQLSAYVNSGHDVVEGSPDVDRISVAGGNDLVHAGDGGDLVAGGEGADTVRGEGGADFVLGGPGDDRLSGGEGDDTIFGNVGRDTIAGGGGDDLIFGGRDYDVIHGGEGDDRIYTDLGGDDVWGDAGNDTIFVEGDGEDWVFFGSGSGQDRVDGFDPETFDVIYIQRHVNNTDIVDFETLVGRIADDQFGNAIIDLGGANWVRLTDVDWRQADASWFRFFDAADYPADGLLGAAAL